MLPCSPAENSDLGLDLEGFRALFETQVARLPGEAGRGGTCARIGEPQARLMRPLKEGTHRNQLQHRRAYAPAILVKQEKLPSSRAQEDDDRWAAIGFLPKARKRNNVERIDSRRMGR